MNITFFKTLCLRIPAYSAQHYKLPPGDIMQLIHNDTFMDALYVASPQFYHTCRKWASGKISDEKKAKKIKATLFKYHNRMCYRPTPFGLFSSCSAVNWGNDTAMMVDPEKTSYAIRPDTQFLSTIIETIEQQFTGELDYRLNSSLYQVGNEYRYYAYENHAKKRKYRISAVEDSEELAYIMQLLAENDLSFIQLQISLCTRFKADKDDATAYLKELIADQFLVNTLQLKLSSKNPLAHLSGSLKNMAARANHTGMQATNDALENLSRHLKYTQTKPGISKHLQKLQEIAAGIPVDFGLNALFQVDAYSHLIHKTVYTGIQNQLTKALHVLQILSSPTEEEKWLKHIKQQLQDKFGNRPVLLTQLFDPDTGISGAVSDTHTSFGHAILDELNLIARPINHTLINDAPPNAAQKLLNQKLKEALEAGSITIRITEDEIRQLEKLGTAEQPPVTFPVIFKIVQQPGATLLIESAGGATGTTLIGRFGKDNDDFMQLLQDIAQAEKKAYPDVIIAAVVHLPQGRTGNVLQNLCVRDYEIPYLSASSLPRENQIYANELYVYMDNSRLRLYSPKLGKHIIPSIDNAHNYTLDALPVYRFLGAVQNENHQKNRGIACSTLHHSTRFSPRIQYNNILLQGARWIFQSDDIQTILAAEGPAAFQLFNTKLERWLVPQLFLWAQGDQTLLINRADPESLQLFINEIRGSESITIKEYIQPDPNSVTDNIHYPYNHQLVAIAHVQPEIDELRALKPIPNINKAQRTFFPGSEWYYYKIYCSEFFADKLLCHILYPLIIKWKKRGLIDKWFFIRYNDPENHIRLRFHFAGTNYQQTLTQRLLRVLSSFIKDGLVWKTQTDTYEREPERYTAAAYPVIEDLFHLDSTYCLEILRQQEAFDLEEIPLLWFSIQKIDTLFNLFAYPPTVKYALAVNVSDALQGEFKITPEEKDIIHRYYHALNHSIRKFLAAPDLLSPDKHWLQAFHENNRNQQKLFEKNQHLFTQSTTSQQIATSLIHMHFNRLFSTGQRRFEMIGYMVIAIYYKNQVRNQKVRQ
jgi:thiopeptide-type bacteriocin biosynthesis protein